MAHAEDEEPFALVRRSDFLRSKQARRNAIAHALKLSDDFVCSKRQMTGDVLEEDGAWSDDAEKISDGGPKMSRIVSTKSLAGVAEWLARIAANDEIHDASEGPTVEGA